MAVSSKNFLLPTVSLVLLSFIATAYGQRLYVDAGGKRFTISNLVKRNWFQANLACAAAGMSLAAIETEAEYTALYDYLTKRNLVSNGFWLSGTTLAETENKEVTWFSNGQTLSSTMRQIGGVSETVTSNQCLHTNTEFKWNPADCNDSKNYYICSRPLVPNCGITGRCKRIN